MTSKKTDTQAADEAAPEAVKVEVLVVAPSHPVYRDKVYTSRTLVLASGATHKVIAGKVTADTDELLSFVSAHEEFVLQE